MGGYLKTVPKWKKYLYIPISLFCCGISGFTQSRNPEDEKDELRYSNMLGWNDLRMEEHWDRLANGDESWYHVVKNLGVEWCRLDPQRGVKVTSMLWLLGLFIALLLGVSFGAITVGVFL